MFGMLARQQSRTLVIDDGVPLPVSPRETILNSALRADFDFPYSCKVGGCGACKCRLVSGKVRELTDKSYLLSKEEIRQGYILGCQSMPLTDVVVRLPADPLARQRVSGRILGQVPLTHDIFEVFVRLDRPLRYLPGQHASVEAEGTGIPARCYSFAHDCAADGQDEVSFFVRAVPQGRMSHWLIDPASCGQPVRLRASLGEFHLRESPRDLLCVAGGSGLAPLIALLEAAARGDAARRNVVLLMGARRQRDLYYLEQIEALRRQWRGRFEFVPILSEEPAGSGWSGMRGLVTEGVTAANAREAEGYLCGPPPMIDAVIARMSAFGADPGRIYFDKFADQTAAARAMPGR
ncbi:MAG: 2Fe-2S iron-sulfur cluster binding domain-containing protein [Nevskia sp.]|nr:2Fe-2S iron-sulfur cluster binding domain-containing protein [Nevskia sp.]